MWLVASSASAGCRHRCYHRHSRTAPTRPTPPTTRINDDFFVSMLQLPPQVGGIHLSNLSDLPGPPQRVTTMSVIVAAQMGSIWNNVRRRGSLAGLDSVWIGTYIRTTRKGSRSWGGSNHFKLQAARVTGTTLPTILVWCLTNTLTNLRVLLAVGCVALPRVVTATARHRALPTTKMPSQLHKRICETPH